MMTEKMRWSAITNGIIRSTSRRTQRRIIKAISLGPVCLIVLLLLYIIALSQREIPKHVAAVRDIVRTFDYHRLRNTVWVYGTEQDLTDEIDPEGPADYSAPLKTIHVTKTMERRQRIYEELNECTQYRDTVTRRPGVIHDPYHSHRYLYGAWLGWCAAFSEDTHLIEKNIKEGVYSSVHYHISESCWPTCYTNSFKLMLLVRHPFERLYTYYKQNFKDLPASKYYIFALTIAIESRVNTSSLYALKKHVEGATIFLEKAKEGARDLNHYYDRSNPLLNPLGPTFAEYLSYLLKHRPNCPGSMLLHPLCKMCGEKYTYILNFYAMKREILFLWKDGVPPVRNSRSMYSYPSEQEFLLEETRSAFTSVPDQIVLELANIFRADLDFIERI